MYLTLILTALGPASANAVLKFWFVTGDDDTENSVDVFQTSSESIEMLTIQWYMQLIQAGCFLVVHTVRWQFDHVLNCGKWLKKLVYLCLITILILVPIASCVHWGLKYKLAWEDETNRIQPWLFFFPAMGILSILFYCFELHGVVMELGKEPELEPGVADVDPLQYPSVAGI